MRRSSGSFGIAPILPVIPEHPGIQDFQFSRTRAFASVPILWHDKKDRLFHFSLCPVFGAKQLGDRSEEWTV